MLVFSAIVPHSPLLMPTIGKQNRHALSATLQSFDALSRRLEESRPDAVIVLSPHGSILEKEFPLQYAASYEARFDRFGDVETVLTFNGSTHIADALWQRIAQDFPVARINDPVIDYGTAIPSHCLKLSVPILPLGTALLDEHAHYQYGTCLGDALHHADARLAVLGSLDLSHRLGPASPTGYSPHGKTFDAYILRMMQRGRMKDLSALDAALAKEAGSCGIEILWMLWGVLHGRTYTTELLSYESPFDVGYAVVNFGL